MASAFPNSFSTYGLAYSGIVVCDVAVGCDGGEGEHMVLSLKSNGHRMGSVLVAHTR